jgi:hypothetical protein
LSGRGCQRSMFDRLGEHQPGGFSLARLRFDRGINLLKVLGPPHHFQGMGVLPWDFIEPSLVGPSRQMTELPRTACSMARIRNTAPHRYDRPQARPPSGTSWRALLTPPPPQTTKGRRRLRRSGRGRGGTDVRTSGVSAHGARHQPLVSFGRPRRDSHPSRYHARGQDRRQIV